MKKELLLKHIRKQTNNQEAKEVVSWIDESLANEQYYISLLNTSAIEDLSEDTKPKFVENGKERLDHARGLVMSRILNDEKKKSGRLYIKVFAIAASFLLFVSIGVNIYQYVLNSNNLNADELADPVANVIKTYYTNGGVKGKIVLPDSSVVWLNSCSRITYPEKFAVNHRDIIFEGEGYFDVRRNPDSPMIVKTPKGMEIKVLGTKFMVKSYSNDSFEEATLYSGKITVVKSKEVSAKSGKMLSETEILPGESIVFSNKENPIHSFNVDTLKRSAWKRGELLFEQVPLVEVCKTLERWHGLSVHVLDDDLYNYTFTADLGSESLTQILELMRFTMPINYEIRDRSVYISKR